MPSITLKTGKAWISNAVMGHSGELYLLKLQDTGYWLNHLRQANKPYELVAESAQWATAEFERQQRQPGGYVVRGEWQLWV